MSAADLTLHGWDWARLAFGLVVFLLPGVAAADRWLRGVPFPFVWAPVLSFTLLAASATFLDFLASVDVAVATTTLLALGLAGLLGRPRLQRWWRGRRRNSTHPRPARAVRPIRPWTLVGLALVLPFLFVVHSLPHLPGPAPTGPADVPELIARRALDAARGDDDPYPVHVDEHLHLAHIAAIDRTGEVEIADPYTGEDDAVALFTVSGLRSERGWQVAIAQLHQLTGASLPTLAHFLPALWSAYLGLCLWATLRPAPGAAAAAALTASLPTTLRFLGVGFLVPSAFALPWILAVLAVAHRGHGPGRLVALATLVTGGYLMHIVPGTLALVAGLLAAALRPGPWAERLGLVGALLLPLVWILPASAHDIETAVTSLNGLPFQTAIFRSLGLGMLVTAVAGAAWAWGRPWGAHVPHRVLSILALGAIASMAWSIEAEHSNDATYGRLIPTFFLCLSALAGLAIGLLGESVLRATRRRWPRTLTGPMAAGVVGVVTMAIVLPPVHHHLAQPYYRIFDDTQWSMVDGLAASPAGPGDIVFGHPWRTPIYSMASGARPWDYLLPGQPPVHGDDYAYYVDTEGANEAWFDARGITYVVDAIPPRANHTQVSPGVFRLA